MRTLVRALLWGLAIILAIVLVAGGLTAGLAYWKYSRVARLDVKPEIAKTVLLPGNQPQIGQTIDAVVTLESPWDKKPIQAELFPGDGSQLAGKIKIERTKLGWGESVWRIVCPLQAYKIGTVPVGKISITFSPGESGKPVTLTTEAPAFDARPIPNADTMGLSIASRMSREAAQNARRHVGLIIAGAVLLLVIIALFVVWLIARRRVGGERKLEPWEVALNDLDLLSHDFKSGKMAGLMCISSLTDIVRGYLEARFRIRAPRQTTSEFLRGLDSPASPLKNADRNFLRNFMNSADMVKFARVDAPKEQIEETIDRATALVRESVPTSEEIENSPSNA